MSHADPAVTSVIPHRPPFLFVDAVEEISETRLVARRLIRPEEPHFAGHYPGNPLMPGVLLCEACFQAGAILLVHRLRAAGQSESGRTPILSRVTEAKFKRMVRPGDLIRLEIEFQETITQFHFLRGRVLVGGKAALTLAFALALIDESPGAAAPGQNS